MSFSASEWRVSQRSLPAHGNGTKLLCISPEDLDGMLESYATFANEKLCKERDELALLLDTPEVDDFDKAIPLEASHQIKRWGIENDARKEPQDWFWLIGYLAGKALRSHLDGNVEKAKHHCITTAAALRNWHSYID